jgi:hypothetical protein
MRAIGSGLLSVRDRQPLQLCVSQQPDCKPYEQTRGPEIADGRMVEFIDTVCVGLEAVAVELSAR